MTENKIPKIIHYCWFGGNEKPELVKKCIQSWEKHLPDYKIIQWDETNFDIECCQYVKDAYKHKKWAYITDYVRLWCIEKMGGIYLDADVQVTKSLDRFLKYRAFTGHETSELMLAAVMGAEPHHYWIAFLLDYYKTANFDPHNLTPNTQIVTALSRSLVERQKYGFTYLKHGVVIFPVTYFAGFDHQQMKPIVTEDTHALHHFAGTWLGRETSGRIIDD